MIGLSGRREMANSQSIADPAIARTLVPPGQIRSKESKRPSWMTAISILQQLSTRR